MIVEEIKIKRARAPFDCTPATGSALNRVQSRQQCYWREVRVDPGHGIYEIRLVWASKRRGLDKPR
jgi:hypothetical protein